ncbi:MAG: cupin domain-containing protein [Siculibacillus sp.]|nr:cupin domain-containing protein [Siculibacillus sp.]
MPTTVIIDPSEVEESNATTYPEPLRAAAALRWNRRLGPIAGLTNFGVNLTRITPGGQSSHRHAHTTQDEFVWVLEGEPTLETDVGERRLSPGLCVGFPKGTGDAHRFVNRTDRDVLLLVVGDRTPGDEVIYPDVDLHGRMGADGRYVFTRKDGSSH